MTFRGPEMNLLRAGAMQKTGAFLHEMTETAVLALREDVERDDLTASPDEYVLRANAIALGTANAGALELADSVYEALDAEVVKFSQFTGKKRHRGTILANRGLLNIHMRRYDEAVPLFLHLAEKVDPETYGVVPEDSFANVLRRQVLDDPAVKLLLDTLQSAQIPADPPVSAKDVTDVTSFLGQGRFTLYAALLSLRENIRIALKMPTLYTHLRILDSLRVFAFQLEEYVSRLAVVDAKQRGLPEPSDHTALTLVDALRALFCGAVRKTSWWPRFQKEMDKNKPVAGLQRIEAESKRLQGLAERKVSTWEDIVVTSLAILHLTRNISAHQIYPPGYLVSTEANLERVVGWLAMSGVAVHREAFRV